MSEVANRCWIECRVVDLDVVDGADHHARPDSLRPDNPWVSGREGRWIGQGLDRSL